jgi:hypothetical protein
VLRVASEARRATRGDRPRAAAPTRAARLAAALVALIGCSAASADPPAPPTVPVPTTAPPTVPVPTTSPPPVIRGRAVPARWTKLTAMASAMAAAAPGATADAWGDPAQGCYAVWLTVPGPAGDAPALAAQVVTSLTGLAPSAVVRPSAADGELTLAFARAPYRGQLRAHLGRGQILATACFGNPREPLACNAACARVLQDVP